MEDHYFGAIRSRVLSFMMEAEMEMFKLGIPVKTRHNEVSPAQFEIAPLFEAANIATDHNMLVMEILKSTAERHGLACLLHEKPFAGVNGSGKHNNWSMADSDGNNLLEPGKTPHDNAQFMAFLTAVVRAVYKNSALMRCSVAVAGNDHRLGANEAPPAIISIFLGSQLSAVVDSIVTGNALEAVGGSQIEIGVSSLPALPKDATDRNRTSPFAFTGNKFEFRAVGSSQSISGANIILNTIVAESIDYVASKLEAAVASGTDFNAALQTIVKETLTECKDILFDGNNYSDEWLEEATKRGLPNLKSAVDALPHLVSESARAMFLKYGIFSERESESRFAIMVENYIKAINIEAQLTAEIASTVILPAAIKYQGSFAGSLASVKSVTGSVSDVQAGLLNCLVSKVDALKVAIDGLAKAHAGAHHVTGDLIDEAKYYHDSVIPAMLAVRTAADVLETVVDDEAWPLPKYREMLFVY